MKFQVSSKNDECTDSEVKMSPPSMLKVPKSKDHRAVSPNVSQINQPQVSPLHHARPRSPNIGIYNEIIYLAMIRI